MSGYEWKVPAVALFPAITVIPAIAALLTANLYQIQYGSMLTFIDLLFLFELKILQLSNIRDRARPPFTHVV